jgi:hypothetical protein
VDAVLSNGSVDDYTALISGSGYGVVLRAQDTVTNFGTITGGASGDGVGAYAAEVVNGFGSHSSALISGKIGITQTNGSDGIRVVNFSTITGGTSAGDCGILLAEFSDVTNGSAEDRSALIKVIPACRLRIPAMSSISGPSRL